MQTKKTIKFQKEQVVQDKLQNQLFNFNRLKENLEISVIKNTQELLQIQLQGIDASLANALRRIIIAQIPTLAFHKVLMYQNTSVIPDQLLVHRLGLLPIKADPNQLQSRQSNQEVTAQNSYKFQLKVTCRRKKQYELTSEQELRQKKPEQYLQNCNIYSNQLKWIPQGNQIHKNNKPKLVYQNILIAKLRQNQQIYLQIYAEKGIGKKHAKWSPVSTCFYRLMPQIQILPNFNHQKYANMLVQTCPKQVFSLKKQKAIVSNPRDCSTCRQCIKLQGISLQKIKDHFIFSIESTGIFTPQQIFFRALKVLEDKARSYII